MARIVIALGGNALQKNGEHSDVSQKLFAVETAKHIALLAKAGHELVITHGNGPQVGTILLNEERSDSPSQLDTCVAMSQGEIGYWLQQALVNELNGHGINTPVATIVTQIVVDKNDEGFANPTKPIGPFYADEATAKAAASKQQFIFKEDAGRGWRRVVASPQPVDIIEKAFIKQAIAAGSIVIAAGGGGIPVVEQNGLFAGVEAVIDKDFAAEKLAELVEADILLILTVPDAISINFNTPTQTNLGQVTSKELEEYISQGQFAPGSMLPKVQAALRFVATSSTREAIVTSPEKAALALSDGAGTHIKISS